MKNIVRMIFFAWNDFAWMYWEKTNRKIASPTPYFFHLVDATFVPQLLTVSLTRKDKMGFTAGRQEVRRECGGKDRISHFLVFISMMDSVGMVEEDIPTLYYSVCGEKWLNIPSPNDTTFLSEYPLQKIQDSTPVSPSARTHFYFSFNWMIKPIRNQNIISSPTFRHFITFARRHPEVNFRFLSPGNLTGNNSRLLLFSLFLFFFLFLFLFPS